MTPSLEVKEKDSGKRHVPYHEEQTFFTRKIHWALNELVFNILQRVSRRPIK
tara:strand:- start:1322 stop:1477 length:156 start_codon:yes stop_codon:yes gene_type:complete